MTWLRRPPLQNCRTGVQPLAPVRGEPVCLSNALDAEPTASAALWSAFAGSSASLESCLFGTVLIQRFVAGKNAQSSPCVLILRTLEPLTSDTRVNCCGPKKSPGVPETAC